MKNINIHISIIDKNKLYEIISAHIINVMDFINKAFNLLYKYDWELIHLHISKWPGIINRMLKFKEDSDIDFNK